MVELVLALQGRTDAHLLYAFTSLARFHVTTAPACESSDGHNFVGAVWDAHKQVFRVFRGACSSGWLDLPETEHPETEVLSVLDPLILQLRRSSI